MQQTGALELVAAELRTALDSLSRITGRVHSEELLRHIFANFCIGK
jgi:tRNA modification GTPase